MCVTKGILGLLSGVQPPLATDIDTRDVVDFLSSTARLAKPTNDIQITFGTSVMKRGPAVGVLAVNICPLWKEILDNVQVSIQGCFVYSRLPLLVFHVRHSPTILDN
jgi:hypothetical protein